MVRSRCSLWMRGAGMCAVLLVGAGLTGCMMDADDAELDAVEDVAEAEDTLTLGDITGTPASPRTDDEQNPDPQPWHPKALSPDPAPDDVTFRVRAINPTGHDKK